MNVRNIKLGAYGGLAGGVVFGAMMGMMGMLPMIGKMVAHQTVPRAVVSGFLAHLIISALIGASFAALFHRFVHGKGSGLGYGLLYGGAWWLLGPLTLMPLMMGMGLGVNWNAAAAAQMLPSLFGHLLYGAILGLSYAWLRSRTSGRQTASATEMRTVYRDPRLGYFDLLFSANEEMRSPSGLTGRENSLVRE